MKEHKQQQQDSSKMQEQQGPEQAASGGSSAGPRVLKSLLKKPGQQQGSGAKGRKGKNRVVINEKMNEFFAADYIILIKEECCAEFEEECDCCCQEHEMIRLGNCKECRAELNLPPYECGPDDACEDDDDEDDDDDEGLCHRRGHEDDDDEDDEEGDEEDDDDDDEEDEVDEQEEEGRPSADQAEQNRRQEHGCSDHEAGQVCARQLVQLSRVQPGRNRQQQLRETLSPPEGYKDLCEAAQARQRLDEAEAEAAEAAADQQPVCAECDYYQRQAEAAAAAAAAAQNNSTAGSVNGLDTDATAATTTTTPGTNGDESRVLAKHENQQQLQRQGDDATGGGAQLAIDQSQQQANDVAQRFLVETITMTTVTERRIVREISSSGGTAGGVNGEDGEAKAALDETDGSSSTAEWQQSPQSNGSAETGNESRDEDKQQSVLPFKTLLPSNSLKPNSALRQLFPDPWFISPPPAPTRSASLDPGGDSASGSEQQMDSEQQLNGDSTPNGRLGSRSESLDCGATGSSDSNIKRAIERNALRRSLVARYDGAASLRRRQHQHHGQNHSAQQNNLRSKDLSLEERIRQLTCVNDEDDDENADGSGDAQHHHQFHLHPTHLQQQQQIPNGRIGGHHHHHHHHQHQHQHMQEDYRQPQLGTRTSPSGEERPNSGCVPGKPPPGPQHNHNHHQHNSAYRKITDLFSGQRNKNNSGSSSSTENMPDIGLGSKQQQQSSGGKTSNNRQFLSSLAPLSCVAANSAGAADHDRDDQPYYRARPGPKPGSHQQQRQHGGSGYSLEDIEHALNSEAPDVTRGTPTSAPGGGFERLLPSSGGEVNGDELLAAFVEQDRSRTERIRRRYNDSGDATSQQLDPLDDFEIPRNHVIQQRNGDPKHNGQAASNDDDDEDDELNDYGFNRRPSVRGIKAQFETTNEIVRQLRTRSAAANSLPEACRLGLPAAACASIGASNTSLEPGELLKQETAGYRLAYSAEQHQQLAVDPNNTISRINNMQRQINDIYQSIAESGVAAALLGAGVAATDLVQANPRPASYLDAAGTLPRTASDPSRRYLSPASSLDQQQHLSAVAAAATGMYSTLPKNHRPHPSAATGIPQQQQQQQLTYSAGSSIVSASVAGTPPKCYRTMYFVPHNGSTSSLEPSYYSVQLPPSSASSSPSYAEQIERYPPYPRNPRIEQQQQQQRYYLRPASVPNTGSASSALQLHLQQSEELQQQVARSAGLQHSLQQQQQQQQQQPSLDCSSVSSSSSSSAYNVQTLSGVTYSICPPPPPMSSSTTTYTYQMQIQGRLSSGSSELPSSQQLQHQQSLGGLSQLAANANLLASSGSLSSIGSSLLSSPTKQPLGSSHTSIHQQLQQQQQQQQQGCSVAERGVPEGAASAPAHDYSSYMVSAADSLIPDSNMTQAQQQQQQVQQQQQHQQNPVYYAMNV